MSVLDTHSIFPKLDSDSLSYLLSILSYPILCRLRSTCKNADVVVAAEMRFRYNKALLKFFTNPDDFRAMLTATSSIVSGSLAAMIASGQNFPPNDLDVYTTAEVAQQVIDFLQAQAYSITGNVDPYNPEYRGGITQIVRLARGTRLVDVVVSLTQSATLPIVYFWSTPVMLFFGGNGFCIPYPSLLEAARGLINPGRMPMDPERLAALVSKYERRGFRIKEEEQDFVLLGQPIPPCKGPLSATCPVITRCFGDSFCLQSSHGTVSERRTAQPFEGTLSKLTNVWWRGGAGCGGDCNTFGDTEFETWTQPVDVMGL